MPLDTACVKIPLETLMEFANLSQGHILQKQLSQQAMVTMMPASLGESFHRSPTEGWFAVHFEMDHNFGPFPESLWWCLEHWETTQQVSV
jgi:hypothetical protein